MRALRPRLRRLAAAIVVFQSVSLSALVVPWCCVGQGATSAVEAKEAATPHCAMHDATDRAQHHGVPRANDRRECGMRAACGTQAAALFQALSHVGVLTVSVDPADRPGNEMLTLPSAVARTAFETPEPPPPRSLHLASL